MTLAARTQALLDLVEQERVRRCAALLDEARAQADALQTESRAQAHARMREAFAEERARTQLRLAAARTELQTRRRAQAQRHLEALLAAAWQRLPAVLVARWQAESSRSAWVAATLAGAQQLLDAGPWQVAHASGWPANERQRIATPPLELRFSEDPAIEAGLRIMSDGNIVDATLGGLLADREDIGGRLVAALDSAAEPPNSLPPEASPSAVGKGGSRGPA
ncbi:MAG: hypothetical protein OEU94_13255 [Aquincola sp.]|nr:hypothetical protein [Aquincola sp.]MDH4290037.1 hypothetical protein [Aquincola sp.]MDH5329301.1 hypothetical protein [Aquincola sp.]